MMPTTTTVLIAEDDPVFRRVISFTLARNGMQVEAVGDGEAAFARLREGGIDFLVTDQQMPVCTGLELLQRIADDVSMDPVPTILCTAKVFELDSQELKQRFRLIDVLNKPFSPRRLQEQINNHFLRRQTYATATTGNHGPMGRSFTSQCR